MRRRYDPLIELPELCVHHWLCGDQDQLIVHAACKKCGAKAEFRQEYSFGGIYYRPQPWNDATLRIILVVLDGVSQKPGSTHSHSLYFHLVCNVFFASRISEEHMIRPAILGDDSRTRLGRVS